MIINNAFHQNRRWFYGVLCDLDKPSDRAPAHSSKNIKEGKRVYFPTSAAKPIIHTLIGMGINYNENLSGHNVRQKIGIITHAKISNKRIIIKGFVYAFDFPEIIEQLNEHDFGLSYDLQRVRVKNINDNIWYIESAGYFTGAALLYRNKAAYKDSSFILDPTHPSSNS